MDANAPFCLQCGYNLSGLHLPHRCPECGRYTDPEQDATQTRTWFARRWSFVRSLRRPSTIPIGLWYLLNDETSARIAKRRRFRWLWLPALVNTVIVALGTCITVEYDVRLSHYDPNNPQGTRYEAWRGNETDRVYWFNLHFTTLGHPAPTGYSTLVKRTQCDIGYSLPTESDPLNFFFLVSPWCAVVFGHAAGRAVLRFWARRKAVRLGYPQLALSANVATATLTPAHGLAIWSWLVTNVAFGFMYFTDSALESAWGGYLLLIAPGWWCLVGLVGWSFLLSRDRARALFTSPVSFGLLVALITVGGPIAIFIIVFKTAGW